MSYDPAMRDGISEGGGPGAVDWGDVGGTLSDQIDLNTSLSGKELVGVAAAAVATHAALGDPHPGYLTPTEGNAAYDALGAATTSTAAHATAGDPHPQYLTAGELPWMLGQDGMDGDGGPPGAAGVAGVAGATGGAGATGPAGPAIFLLEEGADGTDGAPGQAGAAGAAGSPGAQGPAGPALFILYDPIDGEMGPPSPSSPVQNPVIGLYAPGGFSIPTGAYVVMSNFMQLTGTQQVALAGNSCLRVT